VVVATLTFLLATVISIALHVRAGNRADAGALACPRCRTAYIDGTRRCASCGLPFQTVELAQAPEVAAEAPAGADSALHALVRSDQCVGCGACVAACPESGALAMRGKLAVVDPARCVGHGECSTACPVGAITMTRGGAENRVRVPWVDAGFQSSVPGVYIVGELGGRGLIKNAVNEGKIAVEQLARTLARAATPNDSAPAYDVVIAGSGPAGLSAALEAARRGLRTVVLEQGTLADTVRKYPRHKLLLAEPAGIPLYGDLWIADGSKESLLRIWESVVERASLDVHTGQRVDRIDRDGAQFLVRTAAGAVYRARRVVLALGRRGTPRRLGVRGEELSKVVYDIAEMADFAGRRVVVVGGGDSAVESALGLARQDGTTVTLSYRGEAFTRIKERNAAKLEAAVAAGRVTLLLRSVLREVREDVVVLDHDGAAVVLPNDDVVVRIGGEAPLALLEQLGVRMVTKVLGQPVQVANAG
jgi:thioredoxin reductase/Pyruvate/2-oxoacid:ferredoxin oxidoreductase delta subunit